jgi:hypothetical protein
MEPNEGCGLEVRIPSFVKNVVSAGRKPIAFVRRGELRVDEKLSEW